MNLHIKLQSVTVIITALIDFNQRTSTFILYTTGNVLIPAQCSDTIKILQTRQEARFG